MLFLVADPTHPVGLVRGIAIQDELRRSHVQQEEVMTKFAFVKPQGSNQVLDCAMMLFIGAGLFFFGGLLIFSALCGAGLIDIEFLTAPYSAYRAVTVLLIGQALFGLGGSMLVMGWKGIY
jgi:hypothetical protein